MSELPEAIIKRLLPGNPEKGARGWTQSTINTNAKDIVNLLGDIRIMLSGPKSTTAAYNLGEFFRYYTRRSALCRAFLFCVYNIPPRLHKLFDLNHVIPKALEDDFKTVLDIGIDPHNMAVLCPMSLALNRSIGLNISPALQRLFDDCKKRGKPLNWEEFKAYLKGEDVHGLTKIAGDEKQYPVAVELMEMALSMLLIQNARRTILPAFQLGRLGYTSDDLAVLQRLIEGSKESGFIQGRLAGMGENNGELTILYNLRRLENALDLSQMGGDRMLLDAQGEQTPNKEDVVSITIVKGTSSACALDKIFEDTKWFYDPHTATPKGMHKDRRRMIFHKNNLENIVSKYDDGNYRIKITQDEFDKFKDWKKELKRKINIYARHVSFLISRPDNAVSPDEPDDFEKWEQDRRNEELIAAAAKALNKEWREKWLSQRLG